MRAEQEREQREQHERASATAMKTAAFACILIFSMTSVLARSISEWISAGDVLAQPAEEILDSVGREHEP